MKNQNKITLNATQSAGIQLKPEDPNDWDPAPWGVSPLTISRAPRRTVGTHGRVLMKAENDSNGQINLNGSKSFGMLTVFNVGVIHIKDSAGNSIVKTTGYKPENDDLRAEREWKGVRILPGGEIGRSALDGSNDEKYISGIYNNGTINIDGDESIGVGLLQEIQEFMPREIIPLIIRQVQK